MTRISRMVRLAIPTALLALSGFAAPANAQEQAGPYGPMPVLPGACYQVTTHVYGPYTMQFCITVPGHYQVTGGDLTCNGAMVWGGMSANNVALLLRRAECGNGKFWGAGRLVCNGIGLGRGGGSRMRVNMGIPVLHCTYTPAATELKASTVRAKQIS